MNMLDTKMTGGSEAVWQLLLKGQRAHDMRGPWQGGILRQRAPGPEGVDSLSLLAANGSEMYAVWQCAYKLEVMRKSQGWFILRYITSSEGWVLLLTLLATH
jgi:hypothetical protein